MIDLNFFKSVETRNSALQRLDGRVKTVFFLIGIIVSAVVTHWFLAAILWGSAIILFSLLHLPWRLLVQRLLIPFGIAWLVFLSVLFANGTHPLWVVLRKPFYLAVNSEGMGLGLLMLLRIMAAVTMASVLSFSTPMVEILETFRLLRLPSTIVDIAEMMFRYVFIINETSHSMRNAQLCRTTRRLSWMEQIRNTGNVAAYVISKSLDRSMKIYNAMLSRGFCEKSPVPVYFTAPIPSSDLFAGALLTAVPLIILALNPFV